jgi:hypothetical protein
MQNAIEKLSETTFSIGPEIKIKDMSLHLYVKTNLYQEIQDRMTTMASIKFERFTSRDTAGLVDSCFSSKKYWYCHACKAKNKNQNSPLYCDAC